MWWSRPALAGALLLLLGACGFAPLYGGGAESPAADLAAVKIGLIPERIGQVLRNALLDRLNPGGAPGRPRYQLEVRLNRSREELGVRKDETATRANLVMDAVFVLRRSVDGVELFRGVSRATTSFNIVTAEFSALSAEADAGRRAVRVLADDIKIRLAAFFAARAAGAA